MTITHALISSIVVGAVGLIVCGWVCTVLYDQGARWTMVFFLTGILCAVPCIFASIYFFSRVNE